MAAIAARLPPPSASLDATLIVGKAARMTRAAILAHAESTMTAEALTEAERLAQRRAAGEPLAYVLGHKGFYGLDLAVDPRVLVPRPETEHVVETVLDLLRERPDPTILDIGTGSGAIAIAIALRRSDASVFGTDLSPDAVDVERQNVAAANLFQHCSFFVGDLAAGAVRFAPFDAVVANLPYVPTDEIAPSPDPVSYEPRLALDGGPDGLDVYRRLVPQLPLLAGERGVVVFEAGPMNLRALGELVGNSLPGRQIVFGRDYAGLDRVVAAVPRA